MAAAQSRHCLISGCYPAQAPWLDRFKSGYRFGQAGNIAASRSNHRRGFHAAVIKVAAVILCVRAAVRLPRFPGCAATTCILLLLSACGNISCDLLGSDSLRDECQDGIMVKVYSIQTWMPPPLPQTSLRELWQADERAE